MENILSIISNSMCENITDSQIFNATLIKKYPFNIKDFYISKINSLIPPLFNNKFSILYSHFKEMAISCCLNEQLNIYYKLDESKFFLTEILNYEKNNKQFCINKYPNYLALGKSLRNILYNYLLSKKNLKVNKEIENQEINQKKQTNLNEKYNLENSNSFIKNFLSDSDIFLNNSSNYESKKIENNDDNFYKKRNKIENIDKSKSYCINNTKKNISNKLKILLQINNNSDDSIKEVNEVKKLIQKISDFDKNDNHNLIIDANFKSNKKLFLGDTNKSSIKYNKMNTLNNCSISINSTEINYLRTFQKNKHISKIKTKSLRIISSSSDKKGVNLKSKTAFKNGNKNYDKNSNNNSFKFSSNKNLFLANTQTFDEKYKESRKNIINFYENWNNNDQIITCFNNKDNINISNNINKNVILSNLKKNFINNNFISSSVDKNNYFKKKNLIISNNNITNYKPQKKLLHSIDCEIHKNNVIKKINGLGNKNVMSIKKVNFKLNEKLILPITNKSKNQKNKINLERYYKNYFNTRYERYKSSKNVVIENNIYKNFIANEDFNNKYCLKINS